MTEVYADILFLINFIINIILLKISACFMKHRPSNTRLIISSCVGAIYAVFMFFPKISFLYTLPFKLIVSAGMIKIICGKTGVIRFIKYVFVFFLVSFSFAGILLSLIYILPSGKPPKIHNGIFYFDISVTKLILASVICFFVIKISMAIFKRNKTMGIKNLEIYLGEKICDMPALCDTGNLLTDPISKSPVIIAEKSHLKKLFPNGFPDICSSGFCDNLKIRMIPFSSIGQKDGMLLGFVPDMVMIDGKKLKNVIVAISPESISKSNEYNALFNPNILSLTEVTYYADDNESSAKH